MFNRLFQGALSFSALTFVLYFLGCFNHAWTTYVESEQGSLKIVVAILYGIGNADVKISAYSGRQTFVIFKPDQDRIVEGVEVAWQNEQVAVLLCDSLAPSFVVGFDFASQVSLSQSRAGEIMNVHLAMSRAAAAEHDIVTWQSACSPSEIRHRQRPSH